MSGYIILGVFVFYVVSVFSAFLFGLTKGRKAEQAAQTERNILHEKDAARFRNAKNKIMEEVFCDAETKKAALSGGNARNRFNRINDSLCEPEASLVCTRGAGCSCVSCFSCA